MDLRDWLKQEGKTLDKFAKVVGTSQPSLTRYVRGERGIPADVAARIEKATDGVVTVEDLVAVRKRYLKQNPAEARA